MTDRLESFPLDRFDPIGHWVRTAPSTAPTLEPLKGTRTFQTVIIGGGFTGLSTAIALAERGHKVAVIEKADVGGGASGWNCGQVALDLGLNAPLTVKMYGEERTSIYARMLKTAIGNVPELISRSGKDADYCDNGNLYVGVHHDQRFFLEQTARLFERFDMPFNWMERQDLDRLGIPMFARFAIHEGLGGTLNPAKYVRCLQSICQELGVEIYENSPVLGIDKGPTVRVFLEGATVEASNAVIAGNAFAAEFGELEGYYMPFSVSVMVTDVLTPEQRNALGWPMAHGIHTAHKVIENIRLTPDNRLLIGTKRVQHGYGTNHPDPRNPKIFDALLKVLRERFPQLPDVKPARGWTGRVAVSADTLPYFENVDGHRNVVAAGGYGGHGIAMSSFSGQILAKMLTGDDLGDYGVFVNRRRLLLRPAPLRWAISKAIQVAFETPDRRIDSLLRREAQR
jgi:gamma-glutamylputrescine oxidase